MKKTERIIYGGFGLMGVVFLIIGTILVINTFDYSNKVETTGVIDRIVLNNVGDDEKQDVYVKYKVNDREYINILSTESSSYYEGKKIDIYYDKDDINKIGTKSGDYVFLVFPGLGLIFFLLGSMYFLINYLKNKKNSNLKTNGMQLEVIYKESILNQVYSVNGTHPYNIICTWNSPSDGKIYTFKSKNLWFDPEDIIKEKQITKFICYVNKNNFNKYYLDTDILEQ